MEKKELIEQVDWDHPEIREDLLVGRAILEKDITDVEFEIDGSWFNPLTFVVGDTRIWYAVMGGAIGWQIADLVDDRYSNHRGFSSSLLQSIKKALKEQDKQLPKNFNLEEVKRRGLSGINLRRHAVKGLNRLLPAAQ